MTPTTTGRFRVHDISEEAFVLVEIPEEPPAEDDPAAFEPIHVVREGDDGGSGDALGDALEDALDALEPGTVVDAELAWADGDARFAAVDVVRESRIYAADGVEGMFEAATDAWRDARAAGEAMTALTTRSQDGEPNGALYVFADAPGRDVFAELRDGRLPVEPLIARVNDRRDDDTPRAVFLLRPAAHEFVAVYVVFDDDGVLARTVRDTYDLGSGLADGLDRIGDAPSSIPDDAVSDADFHSDDPAPDS